MSTNFNPNRPPCRFFNTGKGCQNGDDCRFVHNRPKNKPTPHQEEADQYFDEKGNPRRPPPPPHPQHQPQIVQYAVVSPRIPMPPHHPQQQFHIIPAGPTVAPAVPAALSPRSPLETLYITEQDLNNEVSHEYGSRIRNCRYFHTRVGCKNGTNCKFQHSEEPYFNPYEEEELAHAMYNDGKAFEEFEEEFEDYYDEEEGDESYDDQNNNPPAGNHEHIGGIGGGRKRTPCRFFMSRQGCKNGTSCPFDHSTEHQELRRGGGGAPPRYKQQEKPPRRNPPPPPRQQQKQRERHLSWREDAPPPSEEDRRPPGKVRNNSTVDQRSPRGRGEDSRGPRGIAEGRERIACRFFNSRRGCERGEECHFAHTDRRRRKMENGDVGSSAEDISVEKVDNQQDEERPARVCRWYTTKKGCRKGDECDFAHPPTDNSKNSLISVTEETTDILNEVIDSTDKISLDASTAVDQ